MKTGPEEKRVPSPRTGFMFPPEVDPNAYMSGFEVGGQGATGSESGDIAFVWNAILLIDC